MSSSQSSSSRPVYIPPNKRNKRQRFHGAFQGGFSAGYFNTVDTKEGWKPSNTKISKGQSQRLEDFMDEQDHEEWGGPNSIRQDYNNNAISISNKNTAAVTANHLGSNSNDNDDSNQDKIGSQTRPSASSVPLHDIGSASASSSLFQVTHQTVGPRLLRYLGWREGHHDNKGTHTAFVPVADGEHDVDDSNNNNNNHDEDEDNKEDGGTKIILSKKKLRQIKLQSTKINKLPPPKLDLCGLGFEAHENAPEFRQHKLRRQKLAQQRAEGSTVSNNVYRTSRLLSSSNHPNIDNDNNNFQGNNDYLSYETTEDFVGTKSVSGFALRDDDDDAYDDDNNNNHNRNQLMENITRSDEYNTEVYEHQDSDDDNDEHREHDYNNNTTARKPSTTSKVSSSSRLETDFGGALASWAGTAATKSTDAVTSKSSMFTSDGRPPVHGFVLGGSLESHKKRYPGPDIPRDYTLQKHKFKENEHPRIFQTLAHAVQMQHEQLPPTTKAVHTYHTNTTSHPPPVPRAMMKNTQQFAGLAAAMKNRFTSSTTSTSDEPGSAAGLQQQQQKSGIYQPKSGESSKRGIPTVELPPPPPPATGAEASVKNITISRTVHTFVPHPLVCKRFGVPAPKHISAAGTSAIRNDDKSSSDHNSSKEAKFFENEIIPIRDKAAAAAAAAAKKTKKKEGDKESSSNNNNLALQHQHDNNVDGDDVELPPISAVERPSMDKLHSIFEPDSAEESSEPDTDLDSLKDDEMGDDDSRDKAKSKPTTTQAADKSSAHVANPTTTSSALVVIDASTKEYQLEKKNPSEHDHDDDDDSNSTNHSLRKRHKRKRRKHDRHDRHSSRRKMEKKKKKKHHKHSHRYQHHRVRKDDDVDSEEDGRSISGSLSDSSPYDKTEERGRRRRKRSPSPSVRDDESSSSSRISDGRRARKERQRRRKKHKGRRKKSDRR